MQGRTPQRVSMVVASAALIVGAVALFIPAEKWSRWLYPDRFVFCGHEFVGSAVVFVVDRSGSNNVGFEMAKDQMVDLVERAPPHFEFGVVFADSGTYRVPETGALLRATSANKRTLKERIAGMPLGGGSCIKRNLLVALDMLDSSRADRRLLIYMGDGGGTCAGMREIQYLEQTLAAVEERNRGEVTIHCVNSDVNRRISSDFLRQMAEAAGGIVIALPRPE